MKFRPAIFPLCVCVPLALAGCGDSAAEKVQADLTIYLSGDLWERGGVVYVNPIPVPEARWREVVASDNVVLLPPGDLRPIAPDGKRMTVALDKQFGNVQFLYPAGRGEVHVPVQAISWQGGGVTGSGRACAVDWGRAGRHGAG